MHTNPIINKSNCGQKYSLRDLVQQQEEESEPEEEEVPVFREQGRDFRGCLGDKSLSQ